MNMALHPSFDQVSIDDLTTALTCMILADLVTGEADNARFAGVDPAGSSSGGIKLVSRFWQSEADRALMRAERSRCFDL